MDELNTEKKSMTVAELARLSGKATATVYKYAKRLGRLPTLEELAAPPKMGRPRKYY